MRAFWWRTSRAVIARCNSASPAGFLRLLPVRSASGRGDRHGHAERRRLGLKGWLRPGDSVEAGDGGRWRIAPTGGRYALPGYTGRSVGLGVPLRLDVRPGRGCDAACLVAGEGALRAGEEVWLAVQRRPQHPGA